jgi:hypothetical protein
MSSGCASQPAHQPRSTGELQDEVSVIASVVQAQQREFRNPICVAREIEIATNFNNLPTTDLAEIHRGMRAQIAPPNDGSATARMLDDAAIRAVSPHVQPGNLCTARLFASFYRIQFRRDTAVAMELLDQRSTCTTSAFLLRLERRGGRWSVMEKKLLNQSTGFTCDGTQAEQTEPNHFMIEGY